MPRPALLAVSHGTSDVDGARSIAALVARVAERLPDVEVREGFVDVQQPDAASALAAVDGPVVIVPLLLSQGFHVHHDLHGVAAGRADAVAAAPLGPDPLLAEVLALRLAGVGEPDSPVVLAVAGSRDERSVPDAEGIAALLRERTGRRIDLAYLAARHPDLPTALAAAPDAVVATYLLGRGFFFDLAARHARAHPITPPLLDDLLTDQGIPDPLVDLVIARYERAEAEG
ncbi:cobalamin biosynthesis protein CbiX [Microbacterium esteraromaticum]|uniref:Cobalamin biosynthesis protein CbiX n=1 Tax=Microbacterium esteraromaticum TaxID=57043 RepID=A0A7D7WG18_9MICO|nr:CbiX/SirB N-terminal domain-containing protein [Microbacterium esteraromaticum]QMU96614.1 cobalamin biosynthesis protein CbiX [Microbacterium esteraromaticum]